MDEKQIEEVKQILTDWNPLGTRANQVSDLANYETEAIDILSHLDKKSSVNYVNKIMTEVLYQAFDISFQLENTKKYATMIKKTFNRN
ncbi:MAG: DUF1871 family protein [Bacteroidales bacterium]|nr:DUF1871 family protein [Bacteroidales bacterium]